MTSKIEWTDETWNPVTGCSPTEAPAVIRWADLSEDGLYRYTLGRRWSYDHPTLLWVMLNPSTADAEVDDPTIRRCVDFAKRWGYGAIEVVNLFAYRSPSPLACRAAYNAGRAVGPENQAKIVEAARRARDAMVAWGAHEWARHRARVATVALVQNCDSVACLGRTKSGAPRHPLYVPANAARMEYLP